MDIRRRKTQKIFVGGIGIGGDSPISIQSMTKTDTRDIKRTVTQIKRLEGVSCELVRVAVLDRAAAAALGKIKKKINIPLIADIHFNYQLAIMAIENGADKIRLNPGNICKKSQIAAVIKTAKRKNIPIRIGLNSGSVKRKPGNTLVDDLVSSGLSYLKIFRQLQYDDHIIFSLKTADILTTMAAYRKMAGLTIAPLHLGITAAGRAKDGIIKSSIGIGALLIDGIGDTIRVSLTADPSEEVEVAKKILQYLKLRNFGTEIISCPTCGRCRIDLMHTVKVVEQRLIPLRKRYFGKKLKIAIMGCAVNGPQEAKDADIGIAWGGKAGIMFKKGQQIKLVREDELINTLVAEVRHEMDTNDVTHP